MKGKHPAGSAAGYRENAAYCDRRAKQVEREGDTRYAATLRQSASECRAAADAADCNASRRR